MLKIIVNELDLPRTLLHLNLDWGWGNGYVLLPKEHKYYGVHYDNIPVDVHYGLTYSEEVTEGHLKGFDMLTPEDIGMWMIGFDTAHYGDNLEKWSKEAVIAETERLRDQLI